MLEVTYGQTRHQLLANQLRQQLVALDLEGSLYIGYPILATADESVTVDALLVTREHGLVAFLFDEDPTELKKDAASWNRLEDRQDQLFVAVENNLRRHETLRKGRRLGIDVQTVMVIPEASDPPEGLEGVYSDLNGIPATLQRFTAIEDQFFKPLQAALQRVSTIRPPKRRARVTLPESKGAILKKIEGEIANLDQWQKRAAIESPEGPQRIRGLAGAGKTVVLALKAAYLHAQNPDWTIAVIFWSRALYQQFEDLVRRFSFGHSNDEPNWQNLRILHAWGSRERIGLYRDVAAHCGAIPRDYLYAKSKYGMDQAFEGICSELLSLVLTSGSEPIYDAVLIDEAQDLPTPFFKLVHKMTRPPHRIIWAYDELQNLSEAALPTVGEQFGSDSQGNPVVALVESDDAPHQDIVLPVCYRNTPWALALAHGLGLGTARDGGLVQSFDDPSLWIDIGYRVVDGELQQGSTVTLERAPNSYPAYITELLDPRDTVTSHIFEDARDQARWVADSIRGNLLEDELEHDDILIVLPDAYRARSDASTIIEELQVVGIDSHLVGVTASQDEIFLPGSIAIANIYRSKGNEASMVYVLNAQHCVANRRLATVRNILFTAITRSKAWVRLCGWGPRMDELRKEIDLISGHDYRLQFRVPTHEELEHIRQIHRDLTASERARINEAEKGLRTFIEALERGEITIEDLPMQLRTAMAKYWARPPSDSEQYLI